MALGGRLHFLSCEAVFPVPRCRTLSLLPPTKKIPRLRSGWRFGKNIFPAHTLYDTADIHPPRCHFERSEKSSLHSALSCSFRKTFPLFRAFLLPSQMDSRFLLSHIRHYPLLQERSLDFARDDDTGIALSKHIRCTLREINPFPQSSFRAQREIFLALCSFLLLSQNVSPFPRFLASFADGFPFSAFTHTTLSPPARKIPRLRSGWRYRNSAFQTYSLYATWNKPIPPVVISSTARNLPCTPSFLAPFAKGFPFSAIPHTALYRCARKIPPLRSGWQWGGRKRDPNP